MKTCFYCGRNLTDEEIKYYEISCEGCESIICNELRTSKNLWISEKEKTIIVPHGTIPIFPVNLIKENGFQVVEAPEVLRIEGFKITNNFKKNKNRKKNRKTNYKKK